MNIDETIQKLQTGKTYRIATEEYGARYIYEGVLEEKSGSGLWLREGASYDLNKLVAAIEAGGHQTMTVSLYYRARVNIRDIVAAVEFRQRIPRCFFNCNDCD